MEEAIITTSWDDGHPLDLKLAELLKKYDVPATFYIPVDNIERESMSPDEIREIAASFDIGGHGLRHIALTGISIDEAEKEIVEGKRRLEELIGREVKAFCYPRGLYNVEIKDIVRIAGYTGARTTKLFHRRIKKPYETGTTVITKDHGFTFYASHSLRSRDTRLFILLLKNGLFFKGWHRIAIEMLHFIFKNGGVWHLWGHSWEIEENNDWGRLESVLSEIGVLSKGAMKVNNSQLMKMCAGKE